MATISIVEAALSGERRTWAFDTGDERLPLREIIRWRVREEVATRRLKLASALPQPTPVERALNGSRAPKVSKAPMIDLETEYARAIDAVAARQVIVLVNDAQVDDLDTLVTPDAGCEVIFLRLTPLVGG